MTEVGDISAYTMSGKLQLAGLQKRFDALNRYLNRRFGPCVGYRGCAMRSACSAVPICSSSLKHSDLSRQKLKSSNKISLFIVASCLCSRWELMLLCLLFLKPTSNHRHGLFLFDYFTRAILADLCSFFIVLFIKM